MSETQNITPALEEPKQERIIKINIEEQMKSAYIDYSMSVIVSRALPDARDGMKPVHRRILYGMSHELGLYSHKPTRKSARIVQRARRQHPRGDPVDLFCVPCCS